MIRSMFKLPRNKKFEFQPRYYDPEKEDLERRVRMARAQAGEDAEVDEEILRKKLSFEDRLRSSAADRNFCSRIQHQKSMSRLRFFIILNILLLLSLMLVYKFF